jgi:hypothetical protein
MHYHKRLAYPTACDFSGCKYHFFLPEQHCISQPPSIGGDFGGPDFTKYKGEVLILISWKEVAKKG